MADCEISTSDFIHYRSPIRNSQPGGAFDDCDLKPPGAIGNSLLPQKRRLSKISIELNRRETRPKRMTRKTQRRAVPEKERDFPASSEGRCYS